MESDFVKRKALTISRAFKGDAEGAVPMIDVLQEGSVGLLAILPSNGRGVGEYGGPCPAVPYIIVDLVIEGYTGPFGINVFYERTYLCNTAVHAARDETALCIYLPKNLHSYN